MCIRSMHEALDLGSTCTCLATRVQCSIRGPNGFRPSVSLHHQILWGSLPCGHYTIWISIIWLALQGCILTHFNAYVCLHAVVGQTLHMGMAVEACSLPHEGSSLPLR